MFEQSPPPYSPERPYIGLRIVIAGGVGILLSFGLCGASALLPGRSIEKFAVLGLGLLILSTITLAIGVITLVVEAITRR